MSYRCITIYKKIIYLIHNCYYFYSQYICLHLFKYKYRIDIWVLINVFIIKHCRAYFATVIIAANNHSILEHNSIYIDLYPGVSYYVFVIPSEIINIIICHKQRYLQVKTNCYQIMGKHVFCIYFVSRNLWCAFDYIEYEDSLLNTKIIKNRHPGSVSLSC